MRALSIRNGAAACAVVSALLLGAPVTAFELEHAKDGSGVYGYRDTPIQPWSGYHVHDPDRPYPPRVDVGPGPKEPVPPPADAVVLFDGKDLSRWNPSQWNLVDGCIEATEGNLVSKDRFGDCQIHVEWMAPAGFKGPWSNQGNSGVNILGLHEIQIFDSFNEKIYADGMAGAIYGQTPPLVNPCRPPGQWQTFDIAFTAPRFEDGKLKSHGRVTVFFNNVLVQLNERIHGEVAHRTLAVHEAKISRGPILLGGHHCPVRFRNIWVRPLTPRPTATQPAAD